MKFVLHFIFYANIIIYLSLLLYTKFKLNDKNQPCSTILIIDLQSYTHSYINNIQSVYLTNQMFEQSLTLLFFFLESPTL